MQELSLKIGQGWVLRSSSRNVNSQKNIYLSFVVLCLVQLRPLVFPRSFNGCLQGISALCFRESLFLPWLSSEALTTPLQLLSSYTHGAHYFLYSHLMNQKLFLQSPKQDGHLQKAEVLLQTADFRLALPGSSANPIKMSFSLPFGCHTLPEDLLCSQQSRHLYN